MWSTAERTGYGRVMVLRARDVMTHRVVTVQADDLVSRAEDRLAELHFSALPVIDRGRRLVGIISLVDVLRAREDPRFGPETLVSEVMTADVLSMAPTVSVDVIANRMRTYGELRVMPIVHRRELVGVVTRNDLLRRRELDNPLARAARKLVGRADESPNLPVAHRGEGRLAGRDPATLTVRDVMTDDSGDGIIVVYRSTPVVDVAELLLTRRFTNVPVVTDEGGLLLGVVSEADMLGGARPGAARTAGAAMTVDVEVVGPDDPLSAARVLLVDRGFRVVPVVEADGRLVGVLSRSDLL